MKAAGTERSAGAEFPESRFTRNCAQGSVLDEFLLLRPLFGRTIDLSTSTANSWPQAIALLQVNALRFESPLDAKIGVFL
jgi:hypothetical protein